MKKLDLFNEVRQLIKEFTERKTLSNNKLAEMLGVSPATISSINNGHSEKVKESMLLGIRSQLATDDWVIEETHNLKAVFDSCDLARKTNRMIGIEGYPGAGKTTALAEYFRTNPNTYFVTCQKSMSPKNFLTAVAKSMGLLEFGTDYRLTHTIISQLKRQESPLLIIDEAGKLSSKVLMYIHDLWDGINKSGGIALAGVEYFQGNLVKSVNRQKQGMPEFYSRISLWVQLAKPSREDYKLICKANGLDIKENPELLKAGNFRHLYNLSRKIQLE